MEYNDAVRPHVKSTDGQVRHALKDAALEVHGIYHAGCALFSSMERYNESDSIKRCPPPFTRCA